MEEFDLQKYRKELRESFLSGGMKDASDRDLLELFLSLVIQKREVKQITYDLLNTFGSLKNIISANEYDLMKIDGITETSAVALTLIKNINKRIILNRNNNVRSLDTLEKAMAYCCNALHEETVETMLLITLTKKGKILKHHTVSRGSVAGLSVEPRQLMEHILRDGAESVVISHNHPDGNAEPSANDTDFTLEFNTTLRMININLVDHIIVGSDECYSMMNDSTISLQRLNQVELI